MKRDGERDESWKSVLCMVVQCVVYELPGADASMFNCFEQRAMLTTLKISLDLIKILLHCKIYRFHISQQINVKGRSRNT